MSASPRSRSAEDRVREAAYTSPKGTRLTFDFEDVSRSVDKRTAAFEFPGIDGAYIQDNGYGARSYPLRCFFHGYEHDLQALAFEAALLERGVGTLQHPLYGTFDAVPFGSITRRDDLKSAANQTIIEVTFMTTVGTVYPTGQRQPSSEIDVLLSNYDAAAAQHFADAADLEGAVKQAPAKSTIRDFLLKTSGALDSVSNTTLGVTRAFREAQSTINLGMDVLIGQPLQIAQQIGNMLTLPARALAGIQSRLDAYGDLAADIFGADAGKPGDRLIGSASLALRTTRVANDFHIADHFARGTVAGSVTAVRSHTFTSKPQAILAAATILDQLDYVVEQRDQGFADLAVIADASPLQTDTGGAIQALQDAVALAAGHLIEVSFSLLPERRIWLDRPRTIIDLCSELYGTVADDKLDFLIDTNDLTGDEILELPRGKSIVYYA